MEQKFLMDTNIVIDYLGQKLPESADKFVSKLLPIISVITRIEIIGWYNATFQQLSKLLLFIENTTIYSLDETIIIKTIEIRQKHKIKLPDAIIAATAIVYDNILVTRNENDFKDIAGLKVFNPWKN